MAKMRSSTERSARRGYAAPDDLYADFCSIADWQLQQAGRFPNTYPKHYREVILSDDPNRPHRRCLIVLRLFKQRRDKWRRPVLEIYWGDNWWEPRWRLPVYIQQPSGYMWTPYLYTPVGMVPDDLLRLLHHYGAFLGQIEDRNPTSRVYHHRIVLALCLDSYLVADDGTVLHGHHVNEEGYDNRLTNLLALLPGDHAALHGDRTFVNDYWEFAGSVIEGPPSLLEINVRMEQWMEEWPLERLAEHVLATGQWPD